MPKELNPLLHSQLRLGVMSILMVKEEADFVYLKEKTESTAGNLSVLTSLLKKDLKGNAPVPLAASLLKGRLLSKSMSIR